VFENRVLRRVYGPKRDKLTGESRKLHNEELNELYSLPNIVRVLTVSIFGCIPSVWFILADVSSLKPLKMDPIEGSETSANINQKLGIHPKIETVNTEHSESFKSRLGRVIKSRRIRWAGHVARMGEERGVHRVLVGKPE
jgi:hypothetical protein